MEYEIIYSERKTVSIAIIDCKAVIKAPIGLSADKIDKIFKRHIGWVEKNIARQKEKKERFSNLTDSDIKDLKKQARVYLTEKTEHFAKIMGLKYGRITITSAQKRFGSCSAKGDISYSYRLMLYPESAREYVVVHELAHLKEMNHSKKFYAIVASVLPDYKNRRRHLRF